MFNVGALLTWSYTIRNICKWVFVIVKYPNMMSSHATEGMNGRN
jgi:hypothetical protein